MGGGAVLRPPHRPPSPPPAEGRRAPCPPSPLLMRSGRVGLGGGLVTPVNMAGFLSSKVTSVNQKVTSVINICNMMAPPQPPLSITGVELATATPLRPQHPCPRLNRHPFHAHATRSRPPPCGGLRPPRVPSPPASAYASACGGYSPHTPLRPLTRPLLPAGAVGVGGSLALARPPLPRPRAGVAPQRAGARWGATDRPLSHQFCINSRSIPC